MFSWLKNKKKHTITQEIIDQIEEDLILADVGVEKSREIVDFLASQKSENEFSLSEIKQILADNFIKSLMTHQSYLNLDEKPTVLFIFGTNGSGKTTTIAKLAYYAKTKGKRVLLVAADTFRAAATEQLQIWGQRLGIEVIAKNEQQKDPATLTYKACLEAKNQNYDVVIIDTSGRFANNDNLMLELQKMVNVAQKVDHRFPHEHILVLDGTLGQASITIVENYLKFVPITSFIITKVDGSSKGGAVIALTHKFKKPVLFWGNGEKASDLIVFNSEQFVNKLLDI